MSDDAQKLYDDWKKAYPNASDEEIAVVREQYGLPPARQKKAPEAEPAPK